MINVLIDLFRQESLLRLSLDRVGLEDLSTDKKKKSQGMSDFNFAFKI